MDANVALTTFTSSAVVVWAIQKLKAAKWFPLLKKGQAAITRTVSVVAALGTHLGVSYEWTRAADGTHTLVLGGLSAATILVGAWHWLNHYALQETIYQATVNKAAAPSLAEQPQLEAKGAQVVAVAPNEVGK